MAAARLLGVPLTDLIDDHQYDPVVGLAARWVPAGRGGAR
jgi:hypothetical protein